MRRKDDIWDEQAERQKRYPKDRIAFIHSAAPYDAYTFQRYKEGRISLATARAEIARNNYLAEVTEEQFLNEFKQCGYAERRKY